MMGNDHKKTHSTGRVLAGLGLHTLKANLLRNRKPIFLSLFITNRCNLRCKYCFVSEEDASKEFLHQQLSKEEIFRIVDEFHDMGTRMIYLLGGEPLAHEGIGEIIDYIIAKGIYLHVVTNGTLIERKIDAIRRVHVLCVSLDGIGDANDELRGPDTFERAVQGIRIATASGVRTRVHAVLTRLNMHEMRPLAELCRDLGVDLSISPPNFLGETDLDYMRISSEEYKAFWKTYLELQREGLPLGNSAKAIQKCIDWPKDYHSYIRKDEKFKDYKPVFCMNGHTYVAVGADGTMYNCINLGCTNGPNIYENGIRDAWDRLLEWRPDCVSCASINCIETALLLRLRFDAIRLGWRFHSKSASR